MRVNDFCVSYSFSACLFLIEINNTENNSLTSAIRCPAHGVHFTSSRPKIVKLHGDYLYDDIKSTLRETESLEQNIKEKLIEFCKEFGLIVIGYSGSDRSIMDVLEFLTKQEHYLENGLYWCLRPDDEVNHTLRNLLWKDRVYPVMIDGFDELLAEIHASLTSSPIDLDSNFDQSKAKKTIKEIVSDKHNLSKNEIILAEIDNIKNANNRHEISDLISGNVDNEKDKRKLPLPVVRNLLQIDSLINKKEFEEAIKLAKTEYKDTSNPDAKIRYIHKIVHIADISDDSSTALSWCDKLIESDENNVAYILRKCDLIKFDKKISFLSNAKEKFPRNSALLNRLSRSLIDNIDRADENQVSGTETILNELNNSLKLDPSLSNKAWSIKANFLQRNFNKLGDNSNKEVLAEHIENAKKINDEHLRTLDLISDNLMTEQKYKEIKEYVDRLYAVYKKSTVEKKIKIKINYIICKLVDSTAEMEDNFDFKELLNYFFEEHISDKSIEDDTFLLLHKSKYIIGQKQDLEVARHYFRLALDSSEITDYLGLAVRLQRCFDNEYLPALKDHLESSRHEFITSSYYDVQADMQILNGNLDLAVSTILTAFEEGLSLRSYLVGISYIYLKQEDYSSVINLYQKYKEKISSKDFEPFKINFYFAMKASKNKDFNDVPVRNLSAQSSSNEVKIAAFSILGNDDILRRMLTESIKKDYFNYFIYSEWPILPKDILQKLLSTETTA
ncbi:MAG: hypothetical protein ACJAR0_004137 [Candidatus Azotimanducaceae bacterium]